jgi:predicted nucleotidyltransferase
MERAGLEAIARRHGARLLLQFGSSVTGREHAGSDVDVAVLFDGEPTVARLDGLAADLRPLFPRRELDLGLLNHADPLFLKKVLESAQLLAGSGRTLAELRLLAFRRYQDHRRYLAMEKAHLERFLAARART